MRLDTIRLATALVATCRDVAKEHWPYLRGDGWPAYTERDLTGPTVHIFLVSELAERLAAEYEATLTSEDLDHSAPWNTAGMS